MLPLDYFDRAYCINLDRRVNRWSEASSELRRCGIAGCERFPAVDLPGEPTVGCTASHRSVWRQIAGGHGERALVLEDDFAFVSRHELLRVGYTNESDTVRIFDSCPGSTFVERWAALRPFIPAEWDLLYLGGSYETAPRARVNRHVVRNAGMHTTHAYGISRRFAAYLTDRIDLRCPPPGMLGGGIDSVLAEECKRDGVLSYTLTPRLLIQRPSSVSDINPQPPGFPWSMTDPTHERMV